MYRFVKQSIDQWYGIEVKDVEDDAENIQIFVDEGTPVILCQDPNDLEREFGIDSDDMIIVERDEED